MQARRGIGPATTAKLRAELRIPWLGVIRREGATLTRPPSTMNTLAPARTSHGLVEELDEEGRPVMYLPRTNPRDYYFLYNPDGYYR